MSSKIISPQSNKTHIAEMNCQSSFYLQETSAEEIMHIIDTLTEKNDTRQNDIPVKILKLCSEILSPFLAKLFNNCISQGIYPQNLKCSQVTPIHKSGPENVCPNYRPTSLLSPLYKIFENLFNDRLYHYVECKGVLSKHQYGFRAKVSTEFAIYDIVECISENLDQKIPTCAVFLDRSKAFDTVDHSVLLWKLEHYYAIRGLLLLFENYLHRREQYTVVNKCRSQIQQINCGLPQGSILSLLLFSLYINDLPNVSNFKTTLISDDTCLILANNNIDILEKMVDQEINKVDSWMRHNKLSLNYSKTVYMIFNSDKKQSSPFRVETGSNLFNRVNSTKYLGMHLDNKLN